MIKSQMRVIEKNIRSKATISSNVSLVSSQGEELQMQHLLEDRYKDGILGRTNRKWSFVDLETAFHKVPREVACWVS